MSERKPLVLIIDDEEPIRNACSFIVKGMNCDTALAGDGEQGLKMIKEMKPDISIIDLKLPQMDGFEVLEKSTALFPNMVAIVITGYATVDHAVEAMKRGAFDFIPKPFTPEELRVIIKRGLDRRSLLLERETLRREKKLLEENFITIVSHQLKSPIAAIVQYFEVILTGAAGEISKETLDIITKAKIRAESLLNMVNDWLDLSRMNHQQMGEDIKSVPLGKLLEKQVGFLESLAGKEGISLILEPYTGSDVVQGNETFLDQLFYNLISNAITYNKPHGSVTISLKTEKDGVFVSVSDTGIGIPSEHLPLIFEQFYRVRHKTKKSKGTGLGLSIAKKIVDSHHGRIDVESKEGKGSTFTVFLPKTFHKTT
ncbi:MAG: hybrid sensor histidine kinase/response regulator [Candidatus Aminicenantes bacterium]|nr:hybrid sensor histidine kinase/response regulator [Candidatus Aminicenantes bacterium]